MRIIIQTLIFSETTNEKSSVHTRSRVVLSFSAVVFAAEVKADVKPETTTTSPSGEVKVEMKELRKPSRNIRNTRKLKQ
jgi:hypothetical protein